MLPLWRFFEKKIGSTPIMKAKPIYALLFFITVIICYRLLAYTGHFGIDDMQYAEIAANILNGEVNYDDHFTFRFTIIAATALSYKLFGINDFASSLPAMVLTFLTLISIYSVLRKYGFWTTLMGLALATTSQWILFYSNKLMPDIYLVFFTILAVCTYYRYRFKTQRHTILHAIVFTLALLLGFMSKGTVALLLPWLLYLFLSDCLQKKNSKFWIWAILTGIAWLLIYFASIKALTGDFLYRFKAIAQNSYLNTCSYDQQPLEILVKRLCFDFFDMTITSGMAVPMVFVMTAFISKKWRVMLTIPDALSYFSVTSILLFLSSNFMTISATSYVPMCIDPRHYLFIVPVAAIASALFLTKKPSRIQIFSIALLFSFVSIYSFFTNQNIFLRVYLPITLVAITMAILQHKQLKTKHITTALVIAMLVLPFRMMTEPSYEYNERRDVLIDRVIHGQENGIVISDAVCTRMMRYYNGFTSNDKYVEYGKVGKETLRRNQGKNILVLNYHTLAICGMTYDDLPPYAYNIFIKETPEIDRFGVKIYNMDHLEIAIPHYDTLFSSTNHFDSDTPNFWHHRGDLSQKTSYSGSTSNKVDTYSATFSYPLDSLREIGQDTIFAVINSQCNCYKNTNCAIVVSIDNAGDNLSWNSSCISNGVKAYSHWFPFDHRRELHLNDYPTGAIINVYFYKTDNSEVYIDDFSISFCRRNQHPHN